MYEIPLLVYLISNFLMIVVAEVFQFMVASVDFATHLLEHILVIAFTYSFFGTAGLFLVL
jgi:hypothetical protein